MRAKARVEVCQEVLSSSKCQRTLRPLKLKIMALERALTTSYSVSDGIRPWADYDTQRRRRFVSQSDTSGSYDPSTKLRKYGAARKHTAANRKEPSPSADDTLVALRAHNSPSVGNAYLGVYYAFKAILERINPVEKFPSLASRAGLTVGRCIHLTGQDCTEEPIEADDWYEACPAHLRGPVVTGHAAQILISSCSILGPVMPALIALLRENPVAFDLLEAVLDGTCFLSSRKSDIQALQDLADQINTPWAVRAHFTKILELNYIHHPAFCCLTEPRNPAELDDHSLALYIKTNIIAINYLKAKNKSNDDDGVRIQDILLDLSRRVLLSQDIGTISYFCKLYNSSQGAVCLPLTLAFNMAALSLDNTQVGIVQRLADLTRAVLTLSLTDKNQCLAYLVKAFSEERIVEITEMLVGRSDELALALSKTCAREFEGDYIPWADNLSSDMVRNQVASNSEKYRYEPLLDSWVTRTPGLQKMKKSRVMNIEDETDDEETSIDEEGYQADRSQTQLSMMEIDCEDELDLLSSQYPPKYKVSHTVLNILSAKKSPSCLKSDVLAKRYRRLSSGTGLADTPCAHKAGEQRDEIKQESSPLRNMKSRRRAAADELRPDSPRKVRIVTKTRNLRLCTPAEADLLTNDADLQSLTQSPRHGCGTGFSRELRNLKSSFAVKRQRAPKVTVKKLHSQTHKDPESEVDELDLL